MKRLLVFFILLSFSVEAFSQGSKKTESKNERWNRLMNLIQEETKILENARKKGPELNYRLLELYSEKLKLIHEKDNEKFMQASLKKNVLKDREAYFANTRNFYAFSKKFGEAQLKNFPTSKRRPEVLYALALNSRDYGKDNITEKYLLEALRIVRPQQDSLKHHAQTALADFYYNEKKFDSAIAYYKQVLSNKEDEWLPKHFFNISWCYLKVRNFPAAIEHILKAYELSKNPEYVNIKDQTLENIGSFYVYAGKPEEGLDFYLSNEKDPIQYLMPMAQKSSEKGHEKETEKILGAAQNLIDKNKWYQHQEGLFHSYLDFYRHYARFADHENVSRKLVQYYKKAEKSDENLKKLLKTDLLEDSIEKMRSLAGFLQIKLVKNIKEDGGSFQDKELSLVLSYFEHLIALDTKKKVEYLYFKGETYYSVKKYTDSAPAYIESIEEAKRINSEEYKRKALNSLLALTGLEVIEKELNNKYLIYAYTEHITLWPKDEKSELIYSKLFKIYFHYQKDVQASDVLAKYNKYYPQHLKEQQTLMTQVLDLFIEKKDTRKLASWVHKFRTGFLSFTKEVIEKTETTLGNLLFIEYQELAKKGEREKAVKGFEAIYAHKLYTEKVKAQAGFFASMTYLEMGETKKSYRWHALGYKHMNEEEKLLKREDQLKLTERTYRLQDFNTSFKMADFLVKKYCHLKDDLQDRFFEISVMSHLVEENTEGAENTVRQYSRCLKNSELRSKSLAQIYDFYEKTGNFRFLRLHVHRYPREEFVKSYKHTLQKWYWEKNDHNLKDLIISEFKSLKDDEVNTWLKEIADFKRAKKDAEAIISDVIWSREKFDGEAYNKALENHLLTVQKFKNNFGHLTSSNQVDLAILSTQVFSDIYKNLGEKLSQMKPLGMDAVTHGHFSKAMKQVAVQFLKVSRNFDHQLSKALKDKETLAWGTRSIASVEAIENPVFSFFTGLTMDKMREQ